MEMCKEKRADEALKMHLLQRRLKWSAPLVKFACNCASKGSAKKQIPAHNMVIESSAINSNCSVAFCGSKLYF